MSHQTQSPTDAALANSDSTTSGSADAAVALHRRMLIAGAGLLGAAAISRVAQAGPLSPPPGPIGSTGRTTDELYLAGTKGCFPLNQTTAPGNAQYQYIISKPGSYYLTADANAPANGGAAILVSDVNAHVNLNGFSLNRSSTATGAAGIVFLNYPIGGGRVFNGIIFTHTDGSGVVANTDNLIVEDICFGVLSTGSQLGMSFAGSKGVVVRRCTVSAEEASGFVVGNGGDSAIVFEDCVFAPYQPLAAGIQLPVRSLVRRCVFENIQGTAVQIADGSSALDCRITNCGGVNLAVGGECVVERCQVMNGAPGAAGGIQIGGMSRVAHCYVDYFPNSGQFGIRSYGSGTYVTDNQISRCSIAINFSNVSGCLALRNHCTSNALGIAVNQGGNWYPNTADLNAVTNPFANVFV